MRPRSRKMVLGICIVGLIWFFKSILKDNTNAVILKGYDDDPSPPLTGGDDDPSPPLSGGDDDPSPPQKATEEPSQVMLEEVKSFIWEQEQKRRKDAIKRGCESLGLSKEKQLTHLMRSPSTYLVHLLVDDKRKAIYCYIPKVACTNWKKVWMVLTGLTTEKNLTAIDQETPHLIHKKMRIMDKTKESELKAKLETYRKLVVVRHPLQRLASAYRDKIHGIGEDRPFFQRKVLRYAKKYRRNANLTNIQWPEFVNSLTFGEGKDDHWESYQTLCHPCAIDYDVIGKTETLLEDSEKFLRLIGAPDDLHFPNTSRTSRRVDDSLWMDYQKQLSSDELATLRKTYSKDFKFFEFE